MTDRTITSAAKTETEALENIPVAFAEFMFAAPARMWTGLGPITATMPGESSQVWTGIGDIGSISPVRESADRRQNGVMFTLSEVNSDLLSALLSEDYQGRSAKLWIGYLDQNHNLIADPVLGFSGRMAVMSTKDGVKEGLIQVSCESRDVLMQRSSASYYTDQEQQRLNPGDLGLSFIMELQSKEILWGSSSPRPALGGSGNSSGEEGTFQDLR